VEQMTEQLALLSSPRKWKRKAAAICAALVVGSILYLIYSAVQVQYHLTRVRSQVQQAQLSGHNSDPIKVADLISSVRAEVHGAHENSTGPIWWLSAHIPYLGRTPMALRTVTSNLDNCFAATTELESALRNDAAGGHKGIDLKLVLSLGKTLQALRGPVAVGAEQLTALNLSGVPAILADPVRRLGQGFKTFEPITTDAQMFSTVAPALLGLDHERKWMLVFQNGAEARATGGFPGGWGILTVSNGKLKLSKLYKETVFNGHPLSNWQSLVTTDQASLYGSDLSRFSDMNLSPDYPTNAKLMAAAGEQYLGTHVDGVISMNEHALAQFMSVTGPVQISGRIVNSENAVSYVTKDVYFDHADSHAKDAAVFSLIETTFGKFQSGSIGPIKLLEAFVPAMHSGNLHAWSSDPAEQAKLLETPLSGSLANVNSPTTAVALVNGAGNKLDAYVKTDITYEQGVCETDFPFRDSTIDISLNNTAPTHGLPAYVTTRFDLGTLHPANPGATKMLVYVHAPLGSIFESAQIQNNAVSPVSEGIDSGRQVWRFDVELPASAIQSLRVKFAEPAIGGEPRPTLWTQSMPNEIKSSVIVGLGCS